MKLAIRARDSKTTRTYSKKEDLKAKGYKWTGNAWYKFVDEIEEAKEELEYLKQNDLMTMIDIAVENTENVDGSYRIDEYKNLYILDLVDACEQGIVSQEQGKKIYELQG
jgi:transposase